MAAPLAWALRSWCSWNRCETRCVIWKIWKIGEKRRKTRFLANFSEKSAKFFVFTRILLKINIFGCFFFLFSLFLQFSVCFPLFSNNLPWETCRDSCWRTTPPWRWRSGCRIRWRTTWSTARRPDCTGWESRGTSGCSARWPSENDWN